jgi:hypothetical protein
VRDSRGDSQTAPEAPASDPASIEDREPQASDGIHRVLLVADERFRGSDFLDELRSHLDGGSGQVEVFVLAPSLAKSGIEHEMADFDGPIVEARERLAWIIEELKSVGIQAIGGVGDGDPTVAVGDGLREFPADEIIVVGHAEGEGRSYSEKDLWNRLKRDFAQPVTALMVESPAGRERAGDVREIKHTDARHHVDEDEIIASRNFPPLRRRDVAGILVGILGTIGLGLIAVFSGTDNPPGSTGSGDLSSRTAAILLIAIGAFLLNVAHVVGLIFFQSVRYDGIWERFLSRVAMLYTGIGLVAALLLWLA